MSNQMKVNCFLGLHHFSVAVLVFTLQKLKVAHPCEKCLLSDLNKGAPAKKT